MYFLIKTCLVYVCFQILSFFPFLTLPIFCLLKVKWYVNLILCQGVTVEVEIAMIRVIKLWRKPITPSWCHNSKTCIYQSLREFIEHIVILNKTKNGWNKFAGKLSWNEKMLHNRQFSFASQNLAVVTF